MTTKVRDLATLTTPDVQQDAIEARAKLYRLLEQIPGANPKYRAERIRNTQRFLATDYLNAIYRIRDAASREDLEQLRDTLDDRLQAGFDMPSTPSREKLWIRLLAEYELVEDALSESVMWRHQDRLHDFEASYV